MTTSNHQRLIELRDRLATMSLSEMLTYWREQHAAATTVAERERYARYIARVEESIATTLGASRKRSR